MPVPPKTAGQPKILEDGPGGATTRSVFRFRLPKSHAKREGRSHGTQPPNWRGQLVRAADHGVHEPFDDSRQVVREA